MVPWVNESVLVARRGEHGITGNIYCGLHEFEEMSFFLDVLQPGDVLVDVGANGGSYSILASRVRGCRSIAFEPAVENFKILTRNVHANGITTLVQMRQEAVSDFTGDAWMTQDGGATSRLTSDSRFAAGTPVRVVRLDDIVPLEGYLFLKIDVEGGEEGVARGAPELLQNPNVLAVTVEITWEGDDFSPETTRVLSLFQGLGYNTLHYSPKTKTLHQGVRKSDRNVILTRDEARLISRIHQSVGVRIRTSEPWTFVPDESQYPQ